MKLFDHVCLLVRDVGAARAELTATLGVSFAPEIEYSIKDLREAPLMQSRETTIRVAYSNDGPPYYELVEVQDRGVYGIQNGLGFHHVGMWAPDCEAEVRRLIDAGREVEAVQYGPDGRMLVATFRPGDLGGTRLEILDESQVPFMVEWLHGTRAEGT